MPVSTWIWISIIIVFFLIFLILVIHFKKNDQLVANRRIIEYFPTFVSTLGVLGTFYGITVGLISFETTDLDKSIPGLLDGLKTAFFTSLAGMIGSMILSAFISRKQDEKDKGVSDINQAAVTICEAVQQMSNLNSEAIETLKHQLAEQETDRKAFYRSMGNIIGSIKNSQASITESLANINISQASATAALDSIVILQRGQESALDNIKEASLAMVNSIGNIEADTVTRSRTIQSVLETSNSVAESTHSIPEILDVLSDMSGIQNSVSEQVHKLKDILDAEVDQIESSMDKTNKLLERKFDEFTDLLKKSNTEALVEVMKNVTTEFQKQMDALISKLIQENFEQLNKSVERLNQWQKDNKEMIVSLTRQYKEMANDFDATSTTLTKVKDDTQTLVSEGGKLRQLIDALNKVIVNDEMFIKTAEHLQKTAELSQSNMESFDSSTKALNEWVRKQRNFVDAVQILINKLEELDKIRDYGEQFWKGTKEKMEEGVSIIANSSQTLNRQLSSLDRQFYARLSATLAELDNCITKMVEQVDNRF